MKKRTLYLIVIGVITVASIIFGTILHKNNYIHDEEYDFNNTISFSELADFDSIEINGNIMELNIESDSDYYTGEISIHYNKAKLEPDVYVKDSKLIINQKIPGNLHGNNNCIVDIFIPESLKLENTSIETNIGEIDISDIKTNNLKVETNIGEIDISNVDFQKAETTNNIGEIKIEAIYPLDEYTIGLSTNVGEVNVGSTKVKKSFNHKGSTSKIIKASSNVGELSISSPFSNDLYESW